jgi:hypothetical protein
MTFQSAFDDLSRITLRAIAGCLQKLEYLAGLRSGGGDYAHWGFGKVYGQATANKTLEAAHRETVSQVLSMPLSELLEDLERSSAAGQSGEVETYLQKLTERKENLLPRNPGMGSSRHLSSVLHALLGLERNRSRNATRRAS